MATRLTGTGVCTGGAQVLPNPDFHVHGMNHNPSWPLDDSALPSRSEPISATAGSRPDNEHPPLGK